MNFIMIFTFKPNDMRLFIAFFQILTESYNSSFSFFFLRNMILLRKKLLELFQLLASSTNLLNTMLSNIPANGI